MNKCTILLILSLAVIAQAAREFNGSNQYGQGAYSHSGIPPVSFSCWFKTDTNDVSNCLWSMSAADSGTDYMAMYVDSSGVLAGIVRDVDSTTVLNTEVISEGEWHHAAFVWQDNNDIYVYMDGVGAHASYSRVPDNIDNITIGRLTKSVPTILFNGSISDAGFWSDYALSSGDITDLYTNKYSPKLVGTPTATWRLNETLTTTNFIDDTNSYDLSVYNAPGVVEGPSGIVYSLGVQEAIYYINTDVVGGDETGTSEPNAWPDMQKAVTYFSTASQDPISLNQSVTIYCIGATADANVPIVGTIPTDVNHPITFVGDMLSTTWNEDYYHIAGPNEMLWTIDSNYVTLQNLQMQLTSEDGAGDGCLTITTPHATANLVQVITSIFRGDNINDQDDIAVTSTDTGTNLYWYRNAIYDVNEGTDLLVNCKMSFTDSQPSGGGGSVFSGVVQ